MERSFRGEIEALKLGHGESFQGEGILAVAHNRTHAFAMKSAVWLMDPRAHLPTIVRMDLEAAATGLREALSATLADPEEKLNTEHRSATTAQPIS